MRERPVYRSPFAAPASIAPAAAIVPLGPASRHVLRILPRAAAAMGGRGCLICAAS